MAGVALENWVERIRDPKIECMSRDEMADLQSKRLVDVVKRVYENVDFYRKKMQQRGVEPGDIKSIEDIEKLPFTTKEDLKNNYPFGLLAIPMKDVVRVQGTSGTTGKLTICSECEIFIGNNVSCSWDVSIFDTDIHHYVDGQTDIPMSNKRPIKLGDFSWLCQKSTILKGGTLPAWSVLGACSLLCKDYLQVTPPYKNFTVFVGNPAKPTSKRIKRTDLYQISKAPDWIITSGFRIINKIPLL